MESTPLLGSRRPDEDESDIDFRADQHQAGKEPDLYVPLEMEGLPAEDTILTVRAMVVGIILGSLANASNLYLGLRTGFSFSACMFSAIFGYGFLKLLSQTKLPILGGAFGPQENCIIQAAATGAGGLSALFVAVVPAMYVLGLETADPSNAMVKIISLTLVCSFLGVFFATPLRGFFIVRAARELRLIFPSATAVALTIQSMHTGLSGGTEAAKKIKALGLASITAFIQRIVSYYAVGILYDWHIFTWIYLVSGYKAAWALAVESFGWYFEWSLAFIGSGMLIGPNTALSLFGGAVLAWGCISPILVLSGECVGVPMSKDSNWDGYYNYLSFKDLGHTAPSPRYWLLWPGVFIMLSGSMAELLVQYKAIWSGVKSMGRELYIGTSRFYIKYGRQAVSPADLAGTPGDADSSPEHEAADMTHDPAQPQNQVKSWVWLVGLLISVVVAILLFNIYWGVPPGLTVLACFLAFLFAIFIVQIVGVADSGSTSTAAKASQLIFGGLTRSMPLADAQRVNLLAGGVAVGGAQMAIDLVSDFRIGFLLGTPPITQWIAQAIGTLVAAILAPAMFALFTAAYPCILGRSDGGDCPFGLPAVSAWVAVAQAVTDPNVSIPRSSAIFAVIMSVLAVLQVFIRHWFLVGKHEWLCHYLPNWSIAALGFILPIPALTTPALFGSIMAWSWRKRWPDSFDLYGYAVASGLLAGEGLGGVVGAGLELLGVSSNTYGTLVGCPARICL